MQQQEDSKAVFFEDEEAPTQTRAGRQSLNAE